MTAPTPDREWRDAALCRQVDPELWWPAPHERPLAALVICRSCPSRVECLEFALTKEIKEGVYGGLTAIQRRRVLAARRKGAAA